MGSALAFDFAEQTSTWHVSLCQSHPAFQHAGRRIPYALSVVVCHPPSQYQTSRSGRVGESGVGTWVTLGVVAEYSTIRPVHWYRHTTTQYHAARQCVRRYHWRPLVQCISSAREYVRNIISNVGTWNCVPGPY
eukprot:2183788-Rhodomonas_salina.1